jgi:DNA (cytosine-5)-methyltransferase 1
MKYGSVCSGIEAASLAWEPLGWEPAFFAEIDRFPCALLKHRWPDIPNHGDITKFKEWPDANIDVLIGGTPCQSFSVAGLRKGMADPRGNLALTYLAIADRFRPTWIVWENVPGILSSSEGRDFGSFLGGLGKLGYGWAYRVLDAQYYGVAQRRRRVFVVGYLGDWRRAGAVLFEQDSLLRHPPPSRKKGTRTADSLTVGANQYSGFNGEPVEDVSPTLDARASFDREDGSDPLIPAVSPAMNARDYKGAAGRHGDGLPLIPCTAPTLRAGGNKTGGDRPPGTDVDTAESLIPVAYTQDSQFGGAKEGEVSPTLSKEGLSGTMGGPGAEMLVSEPVPFDTGYITSKENYSNPKPGDPCHPLTSGGHPPAIGFKGNGGWEAPEAGAEGELSPTIQAKNPMAVCYSISPGARELKDDLHVAETDQSKTVDASGADPGCHQGGTAVCYSIMPQNSSKDYKAKETDVAQPIRGGGPVGGNQGGDYVTAPVAFKPKYYTRDNEKMEGAPKEDGTTHTLLAMDNSGDNAQCVTHALPARYDSTEDGSGRDVPITTYPTLSANEGGTLTQIPPVMQDMAVRRLTPRECERLQGFPDDFTLVPYRGKLASDGPRYKALGNSMAVPVVRWIGERLQIVKDIQ